MKYLLVAHFDKGKMILVAPMKSMCWTCAITK